MDAFSILLSVKGQRPLVHHITNWVTIYDCAAITRAAGALPVMAHANEEAADMARISSSLVLNIGTLTPEIVDAMLLAGKAANEKGIPVLLDAVGAGATRLRTSETKRILSGIKTDIIKGNAGEMATIAGISAEVRGVESVSAGASSLDIAHAIVEKFGTTAVITGKQDVCASKTGAYLVDNGHPRMSEIVGTGCMASSLIASFCAVDRDYAKASAAALAVFGIAGELAAGKSKGAGSFKAKLLDELSLLDDETVKTMIRVSRA